MLHLIVNPVAGRGRAQAHLGTLVAALEAEGLGVRVERTLGPGHATELVRRLPDGTVPVAVGGDGTVHEVAVGALERGLTMGVVPCGSGDDFAFALGLPRHDLGAAARVLNGAGALRTIDVGRVNRAPFVNGFGSGFDADVAARVLHAPHLYRGLGRYLYGIATAMRDFALREVEVTVDGRVAFVGPALLVGVQNGPRAGGSFLFAPDAKVDDRTLDVIVAGAFGRLGTLRLLPSVMRGAHVGRPGVHLLRGETVSIRWSDAVAAHVDGEPVERPLAAYDVTATPGALRVLAPPA